MIKRYLALLCFILIVYPTLYVKALDVGSSEETVGVIITPPTAPINYSTIATVNSSDFWDDLDTPADFLLSMFDGANWIDEDLNLNFQDIVNIDTLSATTAYLTNLVVDNLFVSDWSNLTGSSVLNNSFDEAINQNRTDGNVDFGKNISADCFNYGNNPEAYTCSKTTNETIYRTGFSNSALGHTFYVDQNPIMKISESGGTVGQRTQAKLVAVGSRLTLAINNGAGGIFYCDTNGIVYYGYNIRYLVGQQIDDNAYLGFGTGSNSNNRLITDARAYYNTTNLIIDPDAEGSGALYLLGKMVVEGLTQFLDNVVMRKDLNVTGNITSENVFLPAFTFAHTEVTQAVQNAGVWVNVTFNSTVTVKPRITHNVDATNHTFIIQDPGWYDIHYTMVFADSQATPSNHVVMRVTLNGKEIDGSLLEEDSTKQYSEFSLSNGPIAKLQTGDTIGFQFTSDATTISLKSHLTYGEHRDGAVIKIRKIANYNT